MYIISDEIQYLDYKINRHGLSASKRKFNAIVKVHITITQGNHF